jgi:hypothetical protein
MHGLTNIKLHVHFEHEALNAYSLLMLRKEFLWKNEGMASEVLQSLSSVAFISNPIWPISANPHFLSLAKIITTS